MTTKIIYKVTNIINGKCYIGQTVQSLDNRKKQHCGKKIKQYFQHALNKYGKDNFTWEILCECETKEELDEMEFHYIMQYDTYNNGYNMTLGGEGTIGRVCKISTREKISINNKGNIHTEEWKQDHSDMLLGRKYTTEHKQNISNSLKNKKKSKEHIMKMSECRLGKKHTDETKLKMSEDRKGHTYNKKGRECLLSKTYRIIFPDGHIETIKGLRKFCRDNLLNNGSMRKVSKGMQDHHKGFICNCVETNE